MKGSTYAARAALAAVAVASVLAGPGTAGASEAPVPGQLATFEGQVLNLADGWGAAGACAVVAAGLAECFRTEAEMDARLAALAGAGAGPGVPADSLQSECSSYVRLYDGTAYTGSVLHLSTRAMWLNLSNYNFSNRTSSYRVGACSSYFADYNNGGGSWYPTASTEAYDQASVMSSGWDNRVSSIYIT